MITVAFKLDGIYRSLLKAKSIVDGEQKDKLLRTLATSLAPDIRHRIHVEGKKADGSDIGEYSNAYLKKRIKKGRLEGKRKVLSFTRQMENDLFLLDNKDPIKTTEGYGLGFKNSLNSDKAKWNDPNGEIFKASEEDKKKAVDIALAFVKNLFNAPS